MINHSNIIEEGSAQSGQEPTPNQPGQGKWRQCAILAVVGFAVLSLIGCVGRYTGGGSIDSTAGAPEKATFGFVIDAVNPDTNGYATQVKGQFQYDDHAAGVSFHVNQLTPDDYFDLVGTGPITNFNVQAVLVGYRGTYSSASGSGSVDLGVASHDTTDGFGDKNSDALLVQVLTGPFAGYSNAGLVQKGIIQFQPAK